MRQILIILLLTSCKFYTKPIKGYCKIQVPEGYCIASNKYTGKLYVINTENSFPTYLSDYNTAGRQMHLFNSHTMSFSDTCEAKKALLEYLSEEGKYTPNDFQCITK